MIDRPKRTYQAPKPIPQRTAPDDPQAETVRRFFEDVRRIPMQVAIDAGVTWGKAKMPQWGQDGPEQPVILFPYYERRTNPETGATEVVHVNTKYRGPKHPDTGKKTFKMDYQAELIFWGLPNCEGQDEVIIVEGELDALALHACGITNVLSVPNGATDVGPGGRLPESQLDYLTNGETAQTILQEATRVVIAVDGDSAGTTLASELSRRIGREKCWRVLYPDGTKDFNEVLIRDGVDGVRATLAGAVIWEVDGVFSPASMRDRILHIARFGFPEGMDPGWDNLKRLYRPPLGSLTVVTGIPNMGKSTFVDNMILNIAMQSDWTFAIYSPEMYPPELHMAHHLERMFGLPMDRTLGVPHLSDQQIDEGLRKLGEMFWLIDPEQRVLDDILAITDDLVRLRGVKGLVIDPFTMLRKPDRMEERDFIWDCLVKAEDFARRRGVWVCIVAHPTKLNVEEYDEEDGTAEYPIPGPYDISGASHWANFPDFILAVHQDKGRTLIKVSKVRQRGTYGEKGTCYLVFDPLTKTFSQADAPRSKRHAA
jgi:twinkle protein